MASPPDPNPAPADAAQGEERPTFAMLLWRHRAERGWTQEELAERAGLSPRGIRALEQSERTRPQRQTVQLLAEALGLSPAEHQALSQAARRGIPEKPIDVQPWTFPAAAGREPDSPFVGREQALAVLLTALGRAESGRGRMVVVGGEAGVGKTRLAAEAAQSAHRRGVLVAWGTSYEEEGCLPYGPVVEALDRLLASRSHAALHALGARFPVLAGLLPSLLFALPSGQEREGAADRGRLFAEILHVFDEVSKERPLLLVLDDLYLADSDTLQLVHHLARHAVERRWLLVGTYRDEGLLAGGEFQELLTAGTRQHLLQRLDLSRLTRSDCDVLVRTGLPGGTVEPSLLAQLYALSLGNPLFLQELVHNEYAGGQLRLVAGSWERIEGDRVAVPVGVQELVQLRVDRMGPEVRRLLGLAALAGMDCSLQLLHAASSTWLDEEALMEALDQALAERLLEERGESYAFCHPLVRMAVAEHVPHHRRVQLHAALATAVEARWPEEVEKLAYHYCQAGYRPQAQHYLEAAGDRAEAVYAHAAAEVHYRDVLRLAEEMGDWRQRIRVLEKLGGVQEWRANHEEARASYASALELLPPEERLGRARLYRKTALTWAKWLAHDQPDQALRTLALAEHKLGPEPENARDDWRREWLEIQLARVGVYYILGRAPEIVAALEPSLPAVEEWGTRQQQASVFESFVVANLQRDRYVVTDQTLSYARRCHALWEDLHDPGKIADSGFRLGIILLLRGDLTEAETYFQRSLGEASRTQDVRVQVRCLIYLGVLNRKRGWVDEVWDYATQGREMARTADMLGYVAMAEANLAWVAWRRGDLAQVQEHGRSALAGWSHVVAVSAPLRWLVIGPLLGAALAANRHDEAVGHVRALLVPTMQPLPPQLAAALQAVVEAWDAGRPDAAVTLMDRVAVLGREGGYL